MRGNFIEADSIRFNSVKFRAISLAIVTTFLGCNIGPQANAADREPSFATLIQAGFDHEQEDRTEDGYGDTRSTDSLLDLSEDDESDDQDDHDEASETLEVAKSKQAAIVSALARLRKPLNQVRLIDSLGDADGPATDATLASDDRVSTLITDSGSAVPRYQRHTVCFTHRPLYLQQQNLERCGNGQGCLTNPLSALHFVSSVAVLPYQMAKRRPNCVVHAGGDCRCGQSMPVDLDLFPIDLHAAAVQTAAVAGFTFLIL